MDAACAAIARAVHRNEEAPSWALDVFLADLQEWEPENLTEPRVGLWASTQRVESLLNTRKAKGNLSLAERLDSELRCAEELFEDFEDGYEIHPVHAARGIQAEVAVNVTGGRGGSVFRNLVGYDSCGLGVLRSQGVLQNDLNEIGVRALPAFKEALELALEGFQRVALGPARSLNERMGQAHHSSLRLSAARKFASDFIAANRQVPIGTYEVDYPFGPEWEVRSCFSQSGRFVGKLTFGPEQ